jgi:hypothetical protein
VKEVRIGGCWGSVLWEKVSYLVRNPTCECTRRLSFLVEPALVHWSFLVTDVCSQGQMIC